MKLLVVDELYMTHFIALYTSTRDSRRLQSPDRINNVLLIGPDQHYRLHVS